jgi:hypothetical protein
VRLDADRPNADATAAWVPRDVVAVGRVSSATADTDSTTQPCEDPMTDALVKLRRDVTRRDVLLAIQEYDRLGPECFFARHGFGPSRSYELVWERRRYPHKAILGTAFELATGHRLAAGEFEGGKAGAVAILTTLGFSAQPRP